MLELVAPSLDATNEIAAIIATRARVGDLLVLAGEMGSGKTAFAQAFGRALGVTEPITSPTYTLVHSYDAVVDQRRAQLHHADLYRLDRLAEVADLALGELLESDGVLLVEWGDVVGAALGDHLEIRLVADDETDPARRLIGVGAVGRGWATRWSALETALAPWSVGEDDWC